MADKPVELTEGTYIVKPPFFVRLIKLLRSGATVFSVERELSSEPKEGTISSGSAESK